MVPTWSFSRPDTFCWLRRRVPALSWRWTRFPVEVKVKSDIYFMLH